VTDEAPLRVPYVDVAAQHRALKDELLEAVGRVLDHGRFILGEEVEEFERALAELCGTRHAVAVNSGTDALLLGLRALGIGPGDEVITAPNSFASTASAIVLAGARPVFADVGDDYNVDPDAVAAAITPRTRAILPVHLTGRPADMAPLLEHGIPVVEDAAQAALAEYRGRRVGSLGAIGCFSLHPLKTLGAVGDAGAVTTNSDELAAKLRMLRNLGLASRDDCAVWSGNSRLDTVQAAILLVKLRYVERWTDARRANAAFYREALDGLPGLELPGERPYEHAVYHTFVVQSDERDALRDHLARRGVGTAVHYPAPIHLQSVASGLGYGPGSFPVAERQARRILSLPVYPELTEEQRTLVVDAVREFAADAVPLAR
jgi:dTDP-4-amino-4,6-dideoxygalactose transaminase